MKFKIRNSDEEGKPPLLQNKEVSDSGDRWDSDINCGILHGLFYGARGILPFMVAYTNTGRVGVSKL